MQRATNGTDSSVSSGTHERNNNNSYEDIIGILGSCLVWLFLRPPRVYALCLGTGTGGTALFMALFKNTAVCLKNLNTLQNKPLLDLLKRLLDDNNKQDNIITNEQLIRILRKEFNIDLTNLHCISIDIYVNVLKKFLKDWPQWDKLNQEINQTMCTNKVEGTLETQYLSLKDYLDNILKLTQPFALKAAEEVMNNQEIPGPSGIIHGHVTLDISCTRDQLNSLFFRKPHPEYDDTIFNINNAPPSKMSLKLLTLESMLNSCYVNISINMASFQYRRELIQNFKHKLVNKKRQLTTKEPLLNTHLQTHKTMKVNTCSIKNEDLKGMIQKIQHSNRYSKEAQSNVDTVFKIITNDFYVLTNNLVLSLPCMFRYYLSCYPFVRYLYKDIDTQSEKYDLQLEEKISPMLKVCISRFDLKKSAVTTELNWLKLECTICRIAYHGVRGIESLKTHFWEAHQNEPNWSCTHCDKEFCAAELAASGWYHTCQHANTEDTEKRT